MSHVAHMKAERRTVPDEGWSQQRRPGPVHTCAFLGKLFQRQLSLHWIVELALLPDSLGHFDVCTYSSLCKFEH